MRLNVYSDELKGLGPKRRIEIVRGKGNLIGVRIHMNGNDAVTFWSDGYRSNVIQTLRDAAQDLENAFRKPQAEKSLTELYDAHIRKVNAEGAAHVEACRQKAEEAAKTAHLQPTHIAAGLYDVKVDVDTSGKPIWTASRRRVLRS